MKFPQLNFRQLRVISLALGCVFFLIAGGQFQEVIQHPENDMLWTKLGLGMFIAAMGFQLVNLATPKL